MTLPRPKTFRERMLDERNRRSSNIEDRRKTDPGIAPIDSAGYGGVKLDARPDLRKPVPARDVTRISPEAARLARWKAQGAFDAFDIEMPPARKQRGLRNVKIRRQAE